MLTGRSQPFFVDRFSQIVFQLCLLLVSGDNSWMGHLANLVALIQELTKQCGLLSLNFSPIPMWCMQTLRPGNSHSVLAMALSILMGTLHVDLSIGLTLPVNKYFFFAQKITTIIGGLYHAISFYKSNVMDL